LIPDQAEFCGQRNENYFVPPQVPFCFIPNFKVKLKPSHYNTILFECAKTSTVHTMLGVKVSMAIRVERVAKPSKIQWDGMKTSTVHTMLGVKVSMAI
jgi:hypothetical protein